MHVPRFQGKQLQAIYAHWLKSFPKEDMDLMAEISWQAQDETQQMPEGKSYSMKRPHIAHSVQACQNHPHAQAFVKLVTELNQPRLKAHHSGDPNLIEATQSPLTDLGKALKAELAQRGYFKAERK